MAFDTIRAEATRLLDAYLRRFPEESNRFLLLQQQLAAGENIIERSSMAGHVTSSAAVLNPDGTKILLIDHAFLQKWLPPGGHYEDGTLWESAMREVAEETGVDNATQHPWTMKNGIPLDIDSHGIPARPAKNEGAHVHHDFRFLAMAPEHPELQAQLAEVHAAKWVPVEMLLASPDPAVQRLHKKLQRIGAIPSAATTQTAQQSAPKVIEGSFFLFDRSAAAKEAALLLGRQHPQVLELVRRWSNDTQAYLFWVAAGDRIEVAAARNRETLKEALSEFAVEMHELFGDLSGIVCTVKAADPELEQYVSGFWAGAARSLKDSAESHARARTSRRRAP